MAECPDNSTECLLRTLIQLNQQILDGINESNDEFNWDPASFIVTLAIGALAFVVACITVFQGVLAAGQGRIKAGKTAIGPWSKYSTSRFSWTELGMKSTAMVPIIHIDLWSAWHDPWAIFPERSDEIIVSEMKEHGATWVNLLSILGMTGVKWRSYKYIGTDYLPADIQGPPATVHMKTLITLAAIADDYCKIGLSEHGRFLTMTGLYTSISIRQHPVLGTVAAFEMHSTPRTAKPYIFMHSEQEPASALQELSTGERISATSAFDVTATYSLGEGRLCTGFGSMSFNLKHCATRIEADIHEIQSFVMHSYPRLVCR